MLNRIITFTVLGLFSACFWYLIVGYGLGGETFLNDPYNAVKHIVVMNTKECQISWLFLGCVCGYFTPKLG